MQFRHGHCGSDAADRRSSAAPVIGQGALCVAGNRITFAGPRKELPPEIPAARVHRRRWPACHARLRQCAHPCGALADARHSARYGLRARLYARRPAWPRHHARTRRSRSRASARWKRLTFGSTTMVDSYVHAHVTLPAMAELGLRVWSCTRFHDVDFTRVHEGIWRHDPAIGDACIAATPRADEEAPRRARRPHACDARAARPRHLLG